MSSMEFVVGWVVIGLAAAFAAWTLPFRRGVLGLTVNAAVALAGAVGLPLLAIALGLSRSSRDAAGFAFAAVGALVLLVLVHVVWERNARRASRGM